MIGHTGTARVHFGGPDLTPGALRDLLESRVDAVPTGGEILWATYYFRDRRLAAALVRARGRGVSVRVMVEGRPRQPEANARALELMHGNGGLGSGLRLFGAPKILSLAGRKPHLHSKIYCFSHPEPHVFVGSFNPSGDDPEEDPELIREIGDQDRGHNLLVEQRDPRLVSALRRHVVRLRRLAWPGIARFLPSCQRRIRGSQRNAWLFPRLFPGVVDSLLELIGAGQRLRVAVSHLKSESCIQLLADSAARGATVRVLLHDTERRAPRQTEETLLAAGVDVLRYRHEEGLPMHAKFMLVDGTGPRFSTYGSLNLNDRSREVNHEVFVADHDPRTFEQLDERWGVIEAECHRSPGLSERASSRTRTPRSSARVGSISESATKTHT